MGTTKPFGRPEDEDPWERLARAKARHGIQSPIKRPEGGWSGPEPVPEDAPPKKRRPASRPRKTTARPKTNPTTEAHLAEFHRMAQAGASGPQIARALEVPLPRVQYWAKRAEVTLTDGRSRRPEGRRATWDVGYATVLAGQGKTVPEIAREVGTTLANVRRVLKRRGVALVDGRTNHSGGTHPITLRVAALETRHLAEMYSRLGSAAAVADELALPATTTGRLLRARGIEVRTSGEVQAGRPGEDRAGPLRELMDANGVTSADVRAWAQAEGREVRGPGVPPRELIEAYLLARPRRQVA